MPTAAVLTAPVLRLLQRGLAPLFACATLLPVACSDRVPRENVVPSAPTRVDGPGRQVVPGPPQPQISNWILVQLRALEAPPSAWQFADGSPDAFITVVGATAPHGWLGQGRQRELAFVMPSALPLHGIDFVAHTSELQVLLDAVPSIAARSVLDHLLFLHGHSGRRGLGLHVVRPQP